MVADVLKPNQDRLATIFDRALAHENLTPPEAIALLETQDPDAIAQLQTVADQLRQRQAGDVVTYVVNRNINFTNICEQHCSFCAFRRDADQPGAYWLDEATILQKTADAVAQGATEICMQGGLNPDAAIADRALPYYVRLIRAIKDAFPALHLHAFSPQEVQFIARRDDLTFAEVIAALQDAGVGSMPGTAAEVLDDRVRAVLCPEKIDSATWLEIIETAHRLGLPTTSTLLSGHIETTAQQVAHLDQIRQLQQRAAARGDRGITEFILLPFVGQFAPAPLRRRVGRDQPDLSSALKLMAVARLYLGQWIQNHQPSWVKLSLDGAATALTWGCNDLGGTLMEEHITSMAGAIGGTCQTVASIQGAIAAIGRPHAQRDTLYNRI